MKRIRLRGHPCLFSRSLHKNSPPRLISTRVSSSHGSFSDENSSEAPPGLSGAHRELYPGVPLFDLVRGWTLYNMFRCDYIVDNSIQIMKYMESTVGRSLTENLLRASVFGHFGGEDTAEELGRKVEELADRNIGVLFAYTSEDIDYDPSVQLNMDEYREAVEAKCDKVAHHYLKSIDYAAQYTRGKPPVVAIKLTAIVDYSILDRLTALLNYSDKVFMSQSRTTQSSSDCGLLKEHVPLADMSFKSGAVQEAVSKLADESSTEGNINIVDWQNHFSIENLDQLYLLLEEELPGVERPAPLTQQEHQQLMDLLKRLNDIGERAVTRKVRVLMDAEQTYYQPAIRSLALQCMKKYNTQHPVIYDTIQSYLKSSHQALLLGHATAKKNGNVYAVKLVRGAYMDEEGRLAQEQGYENPIHPNKEATDASYHKNVDYLLSNNIFVFMASHNNESVELARKKMSTYNISPTSGQVVFGQLLGMADYVSSPLAHDGYLVYKLLPYGVVREVVPYLARRAQENRGAMKSAQIERELLGKEIRQRLLSVFGR